MSSLLSPHERHLAYFMLGVTDQELAYIENAPLTQREERLTKLKAKVRKTFKHLALKYHPDQNGGDSDKAQTLSMLIRATKEIYARKARAEVSWVEPGPPLGRGFKWSIHTGTVPTPGTVPFTQANVRRQQAKGSQRPNPRDQADRLGKMRP